MKTFYNNPAHFTEINEDYFINNPSVSRVEVFKKLKRSNNIAARIIETIKAAGFKIEDHYKEKTGLGINETSILFAIPENRQGEYIELLNKIDRKDLYNF